MVNHRIRTMRTPNNTRNLISLMGLVSHMNRTIKAMLKQMPPRKYQPPNLLIRLAVSTPLRWAIQTLTKDHWPHRPYLVVSATHLHMQSNISKEARKVIIIRAARRLSPRLVILEAH